MQYQTKLSRRKFTTASTVLLTSTAIESISKASTNDQLALNGGSKIVSIPLPRPKRWGEPELEQLSQAVTQASLFYWKNQQTKLLTDRFQSIYSLPHVQPCSSGSAALHIATAAAGIAPGDEVITSGITDVGTIIGTIFQNAVPVFAELDPFTYNLDVEDVRRKITSRTKAIIAVHLSGNPCRLNELRKIADQHSLILIEDCCQAWGALYAGKPVGSVGDFACFSFQDSKHVACGDGGVVATKHPKFGPLIVQFGDKSTNRSNLEDSSNAIACNYRMSELQAAFAAAQLLRLEEIASKRAQLGTLLQSELERIPALSLPNIQSNDRCVHWAYMCRIVPQKIRCSRSEFVKALVAEGAPFSAGYIKTPIYGLPMFQKHSFFAGRWPIKELGLTQMNYQKVHLPVTEEILNTCIRFPLNEAMDENYVRSIASAVRKVAGFYAA